MNLFLLSKLIEASVDIGIRLKVWKVLSGGMRTLKDKILIF